MERMRAALKIGLEARLPLFEKPDPKKRYKGVNIRLPQWLWDELWAIAEAEAQPKNGVVEHFLKWAVDDYKALKARGKK